VKAKETIRNASVFRPILGEDGCDLGIGQEA
jgi:hypothetical protein